MASGLYTKRIQVIIENVIKGQQKVAEAAKGYQSMGNQYANVTKGMLSSAAKQQASMDAVARKQKFMGEWSNKLGVNTARVNKIMGDQGLVFNKTGAVVDGAGRKVKDMNHAMQVGKNNTKKFQMQWLSLLFFGMAMQRMFSGLIKTSLEWVGINELMSTTLGVLFLPVALDLLNILLPIMDWFMGMPETVQRVIGWFVVAGGAIGLFLATVGQAALGLGGLQWLASGKTAGSGFISGMKGKLKNFDVMKYLKIAGAAIFFTLAVTDAAQGKFIAAIGDMLVGIGFIVGGPAGIAMGTIGIILKLMGDEELLIDVIKIIYRVGNVISSILKQAILSGLSIQAFDPTKIDDFANIKDAFQIAAEQISMEDALGGISDKVMVPTTQLANLNEEMDKLTEQYEAGIILGPEYSTETGKIWTEIEKLHASYKLAAEKVRDFNEALKETPEPKLGGGGVMSSIMSRIGIGGSLGIPKIFDGIVQNGKVISTDPADTIFATKNPGELGGGGNLSVVYNVNVSDKKEFEALLRSNNESLTREVMKLTG